MQKKKKTHDGWIRNQKSSTQGNVRWYTSWDHLNVWNSLGTCIVCDRQFQKRWHYLAGRSISIESIFMERCFQIFCLWILHEVSKPKCKIPILLTNLSVKYPFYIDRPLETAEENISRLSGHKGTPIALPYPECCPVKASKNLQTKCQNCPTFYCSPECLSIANERYHQVLCMGSDVHPSHPLNVLNEAWK